MTAIQHIVETLHRLPPDLQQEVADFADFLAQRKQQQNVVTQQAELLARRRQGLGKFKGLIVVPDDFNEPLDDFKDY